VIPKASLVPSKIALVLGYLIWWLAIKFAAKKINLVKKNAIFYGV
jgi:hypothetical protein